MYRVYEKVNEVDLFTCTKETDNYEDAVTHAVKSTNPIYIQNMETNQVIHESKGLQKEAETIANGLITIGIGIFIIYMLSLSF